ncbi:hypothetical protein BOTCAL_0784g00020 [Botryotinia calthae]|uniref:Uncharacterized protein n=1 Tax=Botryotinia calthae TaxID=38488 RepID=A0A4Y8CGY3_9HELO|nr:hypothetical protein BOTCAL_0784g00020 [Botryotinia calthae]
MPDKIPTLQVLATRFIYDPVVAPHIRTFISQAMDYPYMKDLLSDYMIGVVLYALSTGVIRQYHGRLFQLPIVDVGKGTGIPLPPGYADMGTLSVRVGLPHAGRPFLDPDGLPLTFHGFLFVGAAGLGLNNDQLSLIPRSPYTFYNLHTHPNYAAWVSTHLWNGGPPNTPSAYISRNFEGKDQRHKSLNLLPYTPGPLSVPQPPGYAAHFPYKRPHGVKFVPQREIQMPAEGPLLPIVGLPPPIPIDNNEENEDSSSSSPSPPPPPSLSSSASPSLPSSGSEGSGSGAANSGEGSGDEGSASGGEGGASGGEGGGDYESVDVGSSGGKVSEKPGDLIPEEAEVPGGKISKSEFEVAPIEEEIPEMDIGFAPRQHLKRGPYRYCKRPAKRRAYRM